MLSLVATTSAQARTTFAPIETSVPGGAAGEQDQAVLVELHGDHIIYLCKVFQGKKKQLHLVARKLVLHIE